MNARELFDQGDLRGAIDTCNQEVRADPQDAVKRSLLFELLCFAGDLERADKQLDVIAHLDAKTEPAVQVYHNVVFAEGRRRKVLVGESQPEFLLDPPAHVRPPPRRRRSSPPRSDGRRRRGSDASRARESAGAGNHERHRM